MDGSPILCNVCHFNLMDAAIMEGGFNVLIRDFVLINIEFGHDNVFADLKKIDVCPI